MLTRFAEWLRRRRDDRAAAKAEAERAKQVASLAQAAFVEAYPEPDQLSNRYKVDAVAGGHIVTLIYGATRPPRRCWWHVDDAGIVMEMRYEQASEHIEIPLLAVTGMRIGLLILAGLFLVILAAGFLLPERLVIPVDGAE